MAASTHGRDRISGTVLIVEDQPAVAKALLLLFDIHAIDAIAVSTPADAEDVVRRGDADVVVQDMNFTPGATSGEQGLALFRSVRKLDPGMPVILLTAWTSLETAVQMVKEGAVDYLAKPWSDAKLLAIVENALLERRGEREVRRSRAALSSTFDLRGIVYESVAMHRVVTLALQVAAADVPVLITGPNGAGKEKVAELIQANSLRRKMPFVKVNAGGWPRRACSPRIARSSPSASTAGRTAAARGPRRVPAGALVPARGSGRSVDREPLARGPGARRRRRLTLLAFPLKLRGSTGLPVRPVALPPAC